MEYVAGYASGQHISFKGLLFRIKNIDLWGGGVAYIYIYIYGALNSRPIIDCYCMGAVPLFKGFSLSYHTKESILFTIEDPCYGNLN